MRRILYCAACVFLLGSGGVARADVVATVNGKPVTDRQLARTLRDNPAFQEAAEGRDLALESLIKGEVVVQEAHRQRLQNDPETQEAIKAATREALGRAVLLRYLQQHPVKDAEIEARYRQLIADIPTEVYLIRQHLAGSRAEGEKISKKLNAADRRPGDAQCNNVGGEVAWVSLALVSPEAAEQLRSLAAGKASQPIGADQHWRVIELIEKRENKIPSLEELKPQIRAQLEQEAVAQYITELRAKAKVQIKSK